MNTFKTIFLFALPIVFLIACASNSDWQGNGNSSRPSNAYSMNGFASHGGEPLRADSKYDAIEVFNGVDLKLIKSDKIRYKVDADDSVLPHVKLLVSGNKLCIYADSLKKQPVKIVVTLWTPVPESLSVWNNATLLCNDALSMNNLELRTWNNSEITFGGTLYIGHAEISAWNNGSVTLRNPLHLSSMKASAWNNGAVTALSVLSATKLDARAWNNGELKMQGTLALGELDASAWTNGVVRLPDINAKNVDVKAHTNGFVKIGGRADQTSISTSNGGTVDRSSLKGRKSTTAAPESTPLPPV